MSTHPNHRRGESRGQDNGPRWENAEPNHGGKHCAQTRAEWHRIANRAERRVGKSTKAWSSGRFKPADAETEGIEVGDEA